MNAYVIPADESRAAVDFSQRADVPEIMDDDALDAVVYAAVIADLARVNSITRAKPPTLQWLERVCATRRTLRVLDVGFGHGDMLRAIAVWAQRRGVHTELVGIDINPRSAPVAEAATDPALGIRYVTGRAESLAWEPDVIISSLVAHHMSGEELVGFVRWMDATARVGWLINDLHRHWAAWMGFRALAAVFRWHPIVAHDGAVSVRRAFTRADWRRVLSEAEVAGEVRWHVPFRWTVASVLSS
ncbi:MAG: methyltransferase domain-containing protein [Gemmatimonadaceae bacterium]|nr:methyltransferase domain-containing protein [Gemmatimonadaceae bacterium]